MSFSCCISWIVVMSQFRDDYLESKLLKYCTNLICLSGRGKGMALVVLESGNTYICFAL